MWFTKYKYDKYLILRKKIMMNHGIKLYWVIWFEYLFILYIFYDGWMWYVYEWLNEFCFLFLEINKFPFPVSYS